MNATTTPEIARRLGAKARCEGKPSENPFGHAVGSPSSMSMEGKREHYLAAAWDDGYYAEYHDAETRATS